MRFFGGALIGGVLLIVASLPVAGASSYPSFVEHIVKFEARPLTNQMSLRTLLSYSMSMRAVEARRMDVEDPWVIWEQSRRDGFRIMLPLYLAILVVFAALFRRAAKRAPPAEAIALGLSWIALIPQLLGYYYSCTAASAVLAEHRRARALDVGLLAMALGGQLAALTLVWTDDRYAATSAVVVSWALALPLLWMRGGALKSDPSALILPAAVCADRSSKDTPSE